MIKKTLRPEPEKRTSDLFFADSIAELDQILPNKSIYILTDSNLAKYYPEFINQFPTIILQPGENHKNLQTIEQILTQLLEKGADRDSFLLCFGGGVIGDIGGFAASIFMRGISFGFIPTSLLAMVDASVGGKNGVNLNSWKNIVGNFSLPEFVFILPKFLQTLEEREFRTGMAEVIKHAAIGQNLYLQYLENNREAISVRDPSILSEMIVISVLYKASVVEKDEKETGLRKILNFGHTLGHAIEKEQLYNHGESVSLGMILALKISEIHCRFAPENTLRIMQLLEFFHLPTTQFPDHEILIRNSKKDKKKTGENLHFIFLKAIGEPLIEKIDFHQLEKYLEDIYQKDKE